MEQNLQKIREACIKANPEKRESYLSEGIWLEAIRVFRLADVLLALSKTKYSVHIEANGRLVARTVGYSAAKPVVKKGVWEATRIACQYNLLQDDLSKQSEETIIFLASLLK